MTKFVDEGHCIDVIYFNFVKTFDNVPRVRLLQKLEELGVVRRVKEWIEGWLKGRRQRVVLNGKSSGWNELQSGIPQESGRPYAIPGLYK